MIISNESRVLITGAHGFVGKHLTHELVNYCCSNEYTAEAGLLRPTRKQLNLLDAKAVDDFIEFEKPNIVIHLAGKVGGIGLNKEHPGQLTYQNLLMGANLIESCRKYGIDKFICLGTTCSYPANCPVPFEEEDFLEFNRSGPGMPEITNAGYGLAKRMLYELLRNYHIEYGFPFVYLIPANMYGEYDHFDDSKSHVIPALIKKFHQAKVNGDKNVVLWGDGSPTREFLYAGDCAKGIIAAMEKYEGIEPINLATGKEVSIKQLARNIADVVGFDLSDSSSIIWDSTKPNGQMRRCLDTSKAKQLFGFTAEADLFNTLNSTYRWAIENEVLEI